MQSCGAVKAKEAIEGPTATLPHDRNLFPYARSGTRAEDK